MDIAIPEDGIPVVETFERFFASEATSERVRAAEPIGFDAALWRELLKLEAPFMRLSVEAGGGMGLFDACLVMEQAGRRLAPVPLPRRWSSCGCWVKPAARSRRAGSIGA